MDMITEVIGREKTAGLKKILGIPSAPKRGQPSLALGAIILMSILGYYYSPPHTDTNYVRKHSK